MYHLCIPTEDPDSISGSKANQCNSSVADLQSVHRLRLFDSREPYDCEVIGRTLAIILPGFQIDSILTGPMLKAVRADAGDPQEDLELVSLLGRRALPFTSIPSSVPQVHNHLVQLAVNWRMESFTSRPTRINLGIVSMSLRTGALTNSCQLPFHSSRQTMTLKVLVSTVCTEAMLASGFLITVQSPS